MTDPLQPSTTRRRSPLPVLSTVVLRALVERALEEDLGSGDITTRLTLPEGQQARGAFTAKEDLVVAGLPVAAEVFQVLDASSRYEPAVEEGSEVEAGTKLAAVEGSAAALLAGERVALNFLQRLCGIATMTRQLKSALAGLPVALLDTRKTTPGLRTLEKYAVRVGGGENHRLRLDDGILIKNNHLRLAGGVRAAVERALRLRPTLAPQLPIEVEVRRLAELQEALDVGAEAALLDNMTAEEVRECVKATAGRARLEVSGGINAANIRAYAETGVNAISVGALTHSAPAADINFLIEPL
jgi:nicotinate-nucleotide pyrophosphorylase (carboxylating)